MDAEPAIAAEYARMSERFKKKDVLSVYQNQTTPDYTMKQADGSILSRETVVANVNQEMAWVKSVPEMTFHIDHLAVTGDTAVATIRIDATAIVVHPADRSRADHTLKRRNSALHTWARSGDGWKLRYAEVLTDEGTLDGLPFDPASVLPH